MCYTVAVCLVNKEFGGHEEGGWWYDAGQPSDEHAEFTRGFKREPAAFHYARRLNEKHGKAWNEGRRSISSVLSTGQFFAEVFDGQPKPYPETKPHYE